MHTAADERTDCRQFARPWRSAQSVAPAPLWQHLNGRSEADSPYRRMIALTAAEARQSGSPIDAAARTVGTTTVEVERWLEQILDA